MASHLVGAVSGPLVWGQTVPQGMGTLTHLAALPPLIGFIFSPTLVPNTPAFRIAETGAPLFLHLAARDNVDTNNAADVATAATLYSELASVMVVALLSTAVGAISSDFIPQPLRV